MTDTTPLTACPDCDATPGRDPLGPCNNDWHWLIDDGDALDSLAGCPCTYRTPRPCPIHPEATR